MASRGDKLTHDYHVDIDIPKIHLNLVEIVMSNVYYNRGAARDVGN